MLFYTLDKRRQWWPIIAKTSQRLPWEWCGEACTADLGGVVHSQATARAAMALKVK